MLPDLSAVFGFPLGNLPDAGLAEGLRQLGRLSSRVEARRAEFIAEADRRGVARQEGYGSTTAWLMALSGDPAAVCRSRLAVATSLQAMPETQAAFAAGEVSEPRVRPLAEARALAPEQFARDESQLVSQAVSVSSRRLPAVLGEWRRHTDPEGAEADTARVFARRALRVSPSWSGMVHLEGDLDPEGGSVVLAALGSLSEPAALDPQDTRSPQQCRADALVEICRRHLDGGHPHHGRRPHLTLTIPWQAVRDGAGVVDLEGGPVSVEAVRRLACDASLSAVIVKDLFCSTVGIPECRGLRSPNRESAQEPWVAGPRAAGQSRLVTRFPFRHTPAGRRGVAPWGRSSVRQSTARPPDRFSMRERDLRLSRS